MPASNSLLLRNKEEDHVFNESLDDTSSRTPFCTKRKRRVLLAATIAAGLGVGIYFIYNILVKNDADADDANPLVNFLIKSIATISDMNQHGAKIPTSYLTSINYWLYDCDISSCINDGIVQLKSQTARILASVGQDIYDAAVWQVAMALAEKFDLAYNQNNFLNTGLTADANPESTLRATSQPNKLANQTFTYGAQQTLIIDKVKAYFFRMIGPTFFNKDPLAGLIGIPEEAGQYWVDWKPITGEVAWAVFIGPLQLAKLRHQQLSDIPLTELMLQHNMLTAVKAMQSPLGAIYYTTSDVSPNQGEGQVNPYSVSLENNFSLLSGLNMFRKVLEAHAGATFSDGVAVNDDILIINGIIEKMLSFIKNYAFDHDNNYFYQGGLANDPAQPSAWMPTLQPFALDVQTWGATVLGVPTLDGWFGNGTAYNLWQVAKQQAGYFGPNESPLDPVQGVGFSNQPAPITTPTINVTVTNENKVDTTLRAFALWQDHATPTPLMTQPIPYNEKASIVIPMQSTMKSNLQALQFIDDKNAEVARVTINPNITSINDAADVVVSWNNAAVTFNRFAPRHDIISAEWTLGAINMVKTLAVQYAAMNRTDYAANLRNDTISMEQGVLCLRSDKYFTPECDAKIPASAGVAVPDKQLAFNYANTPYAIPFGWMANVIPSTCATAWAYMAERNFNPFLLGGLRNATQWLPDTAALKNNVTAGINYASSFFARSAKSSIDAADLTNRSLSPRPKW